LSFPQTRKTVGVGEAVLERKANDSGGTNEGRSWQQCGTGEEGAVFPKTGDHFPEQEQCALVKSYSGVAACKVTWMLVVLVVGS
jgi:hypothetical protein